mgnify:CR=1 FL=1
MRDMLKIYIADLELQGVLLFATEQRPSLAEEGGAVISTGHYIHNYPLIYGFANRNVESYSVIPSLHFLSYEDLKKSQFAPKIARSPLCYSFVEEQLKNLLGDKESIYVFPACPEKIVVKKFFMQAKGSGYAESRGALKIVYPRLEHYVALVPPSRFKTVVLTNGVELPHMVFVRIGMKRMGLFKVYLREARIERQIEELAWTNIPVNLFDIEQFGYSVEDFIKVLETRSKTPNKILASLVGYVKARKLFMVSGGDHLKEITIRVPLPLKLMRVQ